MEVSSDCQLVSAEEYQQGILKGWKEVEASEKGEFTDTSMTVSSRDGELTDLINTSRHRLSGDMGMAQRFHLQCLCWLSCLCSGSRVYASVDGERVEYRVGE